MDKVIQTIILLGVVGIAAIAMFVAILLPPQKTENPQEKAKYKSILDILNILELHNKKLKELEGKIHDLSEGIK
jgi:TolA-binding protein